MSSLVSKADPQVVEAALRDGKPVMLWLSYGQSVPSDMRKSLEKIASEQGSKVHVLTVDTEAHPEYKERFEVGKHPVLIGWYQGEVVSRRSRPWASDTSGVLDKLLSFVTVEDEQSGNTDNQNVKTEGKKDKIVHNKPVQVTDATFKEEVVDSELPVLIDFWAEWCAPCRMVAPVLEKLAGEYAGKVKIAKVDVDNNQGLAQQFQIMSIPTLMFVKEGKIVGMSAGAAPEPALRDALEQLIALEIPEEEGEAEKE
jgi:thioredoxin 1